MYRQIDIYNNNNKQRSFTTNRIKSLHFFFFYFVLLHLFFYSFYFFSLSLLLFLFLTAVVADAGAGDSTADQLHFIFDFVLWFFPHLPIPYPISTSLIWWNAIFSLSFWSYAFCLSSIVFTHSSNLKWTIFRGNIFSLRSSVHSTKKQKCIRDAWIVVRSLNDSVSVLSGALFFSLFSYLSLLLVCIPRTRINFLDLICLIIIIIIVNIFILYFRMLRVYRCRWIKRFYIL